MKEILVCKADPIGEDEVEGAILHVTDKLPDFQYQSGKDVLAMAMEYYQFQAKRVIEALDCLPQGVRYQVMIEILKESPNLYRGR